MSLFRYSAAFMARKKEEISEIDRRTRKLLTLRKAHHPKDNVQRLYIKRKEGGRGLISIEECVEDAIAGLHHYIQNNQEIIREIIRETKSNRAPKGNQTKTTNQKKTRLEE